MKLLSNKITKGQKITLIVMFLPASFLLLGIFDQYDSETVTIFWFYTLFLVWVYLILSLSCRKFFEKHLNKISHISATLFILLNIATFGEIDVYERWHWEPEIPEALKKEDSWTLEYKEFCESDLATLQAAATRENLNLYIYNSGLIEIAERDFSKRKGSFVPTKISESCLATPNIYKAYIRSLKKGEPWVVNNYIDEKSYKERLEILTIWYEWYDKRQKNKDFPKIKLYEDPFDQDYLILWLLTVFLVGILFFNLFSERKFL